MEKIKVISLVLLFVFLGSFFAMSCGGSKDKHVDVEELGMNAENISIVKELAEEGDIKAMGILGMAYMSGKLVERNVGKGLKLLQESADAGYVAAQSALGSYYFATKTNFEKAKKYLQMAVDQNDFAAKVTLGSYYLHSGEDVEKGLAYLESTASQGDNNSQATLGVYYMQSDLKKAKGYLDQAVRQGNSMAECALGLYYLNNEDFNRAIDLLHKSAEGGNAEGEYFLGRCYYEGIGVDRNEVKAIELIERAARKGNQSAINDLRELNRN